MTDGLQPQNILVFIPIEGEARRLRPLTTSISKAMVRLLNRPIAEFSIRSLIDQGARDFVFSVNGYANYTGVHDYFEVGRGFSASLGVDHPIHIEYLPTFGDTGDVSALKRAVQYYRVNNTILMAKVDNVFHFNLRSLLEFHLAKKAVLTMGLTNVENIGEHGSVALNHDGKVEAFKANPRPGEVLSKLGTCGIYFISPKMMEILGNDRIVNEIGGRGQLDFVRDLVPYLVSDGYPVYGKKAGGHWYEFGSPGGYLSTMHKMLSEGNPWLSNEEKVLGMPNLWIQGESPQSIGRRGEIMDKLHRAKISLRGHILIGRDCQIGDGSRIENSCIDNFCVIGEDVVIDSSAILDRVIVGDRAEIKNSIIARHATVASSREEPTRIMNNSVIGDNVCIGKGCEIVNTLVFPHNKVQAGRRRINETVW